MPPFPSETEACLKDTMLARARADGSFERCRFEERDYAHIEHRTGLSREQVQKWADHFRDRKDVQQRELALHLCRDSEQVPVPSYIVALSVLEFSPSPQEVVV